ncbi:MAG: VTT domain-containing protein [Alphaproteobacteria bacterium]|nr:VTT domain-containing protein [Alphaproteobacteria bacterium]
MSVMRPLYNWAVAQAEKPYARWMLFFMALLEACLVPLPPDILLLPMMIAQRKRAFHLAFICTVGSVLGGLVGYGIGALAMATLGEWIVNTYNLQSAFQLFQENFQKWGVWIILAKGLTPIPYILVTIASGVAHLNLAMFLMSVIIIRSGRFFLEAWLVYRFGESIREFIERYLTWISLAVLAAIALGWYVIAFH